MSETAPPAVGQDPWGDHLNSYLMQLEERIVALEAQKEHVFNSYAWQFSSSLPPATGNQIRLNSPTPSQATEIDFRKIDSDGADRTPTFQQVSDGDTIRISDWDNASNIYRFTATGPAVIGATNVTVPVVWLNGGGVVPNAKCNVGFLLSIVV